MSQFKLNDSAAMKHFRPDAKQPLALPNYSADDTRLFPRFTRALFRTQTGQQAPHHRSRDETDMVREELGDDNVVHGALALGLTEDGYLELWTRIKRFADLSAPDDDEIYTIQWWETSGADQPRRKTLEITNRLARSINLPGKYDYPKWKPAESGVRIVSQDGSSSTVSKDWIILPETAEKLAAEIGGRWIEDKWSGIIRYEFAPGEERRFGYIAMPDGRRYVAAEIYEEWSKGGIGAPGNWLDDGENQPIFKLSIDPDVGEKDMRPEIPIPQRPLWPTEKWVQSFGGLWGISNLPLAEESVMDVLRRVDQNVQELVR